MYDRCKRRHDDAQTGERRSLYLQRLSILRELMRDLNGSTPEQRLQAGHMLLSISDISEDEESPLHGATPAQRDEVIRQAGEAHQWVQQFQQNLQRADSAHVNAVADQMINMLSGGAENAESESPCTMDSETPSERLQRYIHSDLCEVSDPEEWTALHYRESAPVEEGEET